MVDAPLRPGLGLPHYVLAPAVSAIAVLGLEPTEGICGFSLSDGQGEALIGRQWRGHLVHDGHYLPLLPAGGGSTDPPRLVHPTPRHNRRYSLPRRPRRFLRARGQRSLLPGTTV